MKKMMSRLAVLGVAALVVACGTAIPTATSPSPGGDDGVATAQRLRGSLLPEPQDCSGQLVVRNLDSGSGWVKVEAAFTDGKTTYTCGGIEFSITPWANLQSPRFNPNQVIISGVPDLYFLTVTAYGKPTTVKILIK
jgi:hypothetical protein